MFSIRRKEILTYIADFLLFVVSIVGVIDTAKHAGIPGQADNQHDAVIEYTAAPFQAGDKIVRFNGLPIEGSEVLYNELQGHAIGEHVAVVVQRGSTLLSLETNLERYYSPGFILIVCFSTLVFFALALFVLTQRPDDPAAVLCHWIGISVALVIANSDAYYRLGAIDYTVIPLIVYRFGDSLWAVFQTHFSLRFPREKQVWNRWLLPLLYVVGVALALVNSVALLRHELLGGLPTSFLFTKSFADAYASILTVASMGIFLHSFYSTTERQQRQKLKWIFAGLCTSLTVHLSCWQLPILLTGAPLLDEWVVVLASTMSPISFAISVVRYQLFDIDFIVNRGGVYLAVVGLCALVYEVVVELLKAVIAAPIMHDNFGLIPSIAGAIVGLTFWPLLKRIEHAANRTLFRKRHTERSAITKLSNDMRETLELRDLADLATRALEPLVGASYVECYQVRGTEVRLLSLSKSGTTHRRAHADQLQKFGECKHVLAARHLVESDVMADFTWDEVLHAHAITLLVPLLGSQGETLGFLSTGRKELARRYSTHDLVLLTTTAASLAGYMERVLRWEDRLRERLHENAVGAPIPGMGVG